MNYLSRLIKDFTVDAASRKFMDFNSRRWTKLKHHGSKSEILVELYTVSQTILAFSYVANILAEKHNAELVSFSTSTRNSYLYAQRYRKTYNIYKSFNVNFHVNTGNLPNISSIKSWCSAIFKSLKSKADIFKIVIDGCPIGAEIYEAYLGSRLKPTVEIGSQDFESFLLDCLKLYCFWKDYFETHDVKAVIMSHGIYQYGIIKQIAFKKGIPVYLPNIRALCCLKDAAKLGNPDFHLYPQQFNSLPTDVQEKGIHWAKQQLQRRLSGEVGVDISYLTASAYDKYNYSVKVLRESNKLKVLIATHCFFDAPNAYGENLFPDFYEWLTFLGEMSNKTDYDWYLKTHPDVQPGNDEIIDELLNKYPKISRVPCSTSHHQLAAEGITRVLTVYGSIGHECPLLGQIAINAGVNNQHIGYGFNVHAKSREEYENILLNLENINITIDVNEIYEFYFINFKYNICQKLFVNSYSDFMNSLNVEEQNSSKAYQYFLNEYTHEKDALLYNKISTFIDSGDYKYFENEFEFEGI